ncbi:MAG TPA: DUF4388 domain-containing protein [Acidothermaceae bacterium]
MKLEGSLDAFSLPDIFQLLSFTKKSGGLHLRRATTQGCVYFRDGAVTSATSDDGRQALARRLVGSSAVGDEALLAAVERAASEGVGIGRALADASAIDAELLRAMVAEQAVDAVFDLLRWADGEFSFSIDEPSPDEIGVQLGVEELVNDARSRLESWEHACQVIPSPDTVLVVPVSVNGDPQLSKGEWALLALVDGRRTVADLVALAGRGDFAVVSALAAMVERGLLVVRSEDSAEGAAALGRRHAMLARLEAGAVAPASEPEPTPEPEPAPEKSPSSTAFAAAPVAAPVDEPLPSDESLFAGVANAEVSSASTVASVLAAASKSSADDAAPRLVADTRGPVIPPRPEPFMPRRRPDFPEQSPRGGMGVGPIVGSAAVAAVAASPAPAHDAVEAVDAKVHIERDPSVNKSLLLRLIAGVRGL